MVNLAKNYYVTDNINVGCFEDYHNIVKATVEMNYDGDSMEKDGIPLISDGHSARGYPLEQPMMVVAATGSGKTRRIIIQYLVSCILSACSILINDPKGELYKATKGLLEKMGYKIVIVDYRNLDCGERYNFCEIPAKLYKSGNTRRSDEMFQSMFDTFMIPVKSEKDRFWDTTGAMYLTGLGELACDILPLEMVTINNIYELHIQGGKRAMGSTLLKTYLDNHQDKPYYKLIAPYINAPNDTRASLDAVLTSAISKFARNESVIDQTTNSTFDVKDLIKEKTALFIISRDESSVYNGMISNMVNQIYETVIDIAEEEYNGRLERRLAIILDEFGNLAPIDDINSKITVSRSRNVGWCLCCQSLDQLTLKYGADIGKIILGNCNIAYMYSSDINLLKMISELCGKTTDVYTHETRPLLSVEQLRHFNKQEGQTLFLLERMRPFMGFLPDVSEYTSIVPIEKADFVKRKKQKLPHVDLERIITDERNGRRTNHAEANLNAQQGLVPHGQGRRSIPTFEEWMESRTEEDKNSKKSTNLEDIDVDAMIADIDRKIAAIEAEEAKERAEKENKHKAEKSKESKGNSPDRTRIKIVQMGHQNETVEVMAIRIGISKDVANRILQAALRRDDKIINGVPTECVEGLINGLKRYGTIAVVVDDVAA